MRCPIVKDAQDFQLLYTKVLGLLWSISADMCRVQIHMTSNMFQRCTSRRKPSACGWSSSTLWLTSMMYSSPYVSSDKQLWDICGRTQWCS